MKFLSLIAVVALAATVSADCETCKVGVNAILDYLGSNSEVTEEAAIVKDACCPALDDPEGCGTGVDTWWPAIVNALQASDNIADIACAALDPSCIATKAWDCDTCKARLDDLLNVATGDAQTAALLAYLKGPAFCEDASVSPDAAVCGDFVDALAPCAIDSLVAVVQAEPDRFCNEIFQLC
ncbi:uncharacterized protein LOC131881746 [Tigriopus californicus]|nr:uncharacterized protein LOC131881746 [Tigriopus californicus]